MEAQLALDSEHPVAANVSISTILGIARTLDSEPHWASWLVRCAALKTATKALEHRLNAGDPTEQELVELAGSFAAAEETNLLARTLIADRATAIPYFRMTYADLAKYGDQNNSKVRQFPQSDRQPLSFRLTGVFERDLRGIPGGDGNKHCSCRSATAAKFGSGEVFLGGV